MALLCRACTESVSGFYHGSLMARLNLDINYFCRISVHRVLRLSFLGNPI